MSEPAASAVTATDVMSTDAGIGAECVVDVAAKAQVHSIVPTKNLGWKVLKNSAAQVTGRLLIAIFRLVIAGIIVRTYGRNLFGEYSLLFGILTIVDWLVDFGTTDIFVREICQHPEDTPRLLRVLSAVTLFQIPAAFTVLSVLLFGLRYPAHVIEAGLVGGLNLLFFGGVTVYRVIFRASMTVEREVGSEMSGVLLAIPLVYLVCRHGGGLVMLMGCHVFSRAIYFFMCFMLGKKQFTPSLRGVHASDITGSVRSIWAVGIIGFLVGGYETVDILLLSKLGSFSQLALYSGAQRLVWPMLMALSAVAASFYPVIASNWPNQRTKFEQSCQRAVETILLLAGAGLCAILPSAEFFMRLLGPDLVAGSNALRVLGILCFVKAITSTLGPVLYVIKAQRKALEFIAVAFVVKVIVMAIAARHGYMTVAYSAIGVELCFATLPALFILHNLCGFSLRWAVPAKVLLAIAASALVGHWISPAGTLPGGVVAVVLYITLAFATGVVRPNELLSILRWRES